MLAAVRATGDPSVQWWVTVNGPAADKTQVRPQDAFTRIKTAPNLHAVCEFDREAWAEKPGSWYEKGVQFRALMAGSGADTWVVNEAGSGIRDVAAAARHDLAELCRGLYDGEKQPLAGIVMQQGPGYEEGLGYWLQDRGFWAVMKRALKWYASEVYASPDVFLGWKPEHQDHYLFGALDQVNRFHPLHSLYMPLVSTYWTSGRGYGNSRVPAGTMTDFVGVQRHTIQGRKQKAYGVAWNDHPAGTPEDSSALAEAIAKGA